MRHETFLGPEIPVLLARAREAFGGEAVVVSVRRRGRDFEMVAGDAIGDAFDDRRSVAGRDAAPDRPPFAREAPPLARPGAPPLRPGRLTTMLPCLGDYRSRRHREPVVIALVGPTGAGKTTTIAKLARHPDVFDGLPVGLLGLDTYRIGAVEQLRIYAEIADLPLEVAHEAPDLGRALRRLRDCEIVLVDTAGRGPNGAGDLEETRRHLAALGPAEVHLTLPAGLRPELARRVIERHRPLRVTHLLATKVDEFPEDDLVFELAAEAALPMRWITDGQEVPTDVKAAAPRLFGERAPSGADLARLSLQGAIGGAGARRA